MYIRLLAATDRSPVAVFALGYARSLMAIAPVRVVSLTGGFTGAWAPYADLMATPMVGVMINCVCAPPEKWTWRQRIAAPTKEDHIELERIARIVDGEIPRDGIISHFSRAVAARQIPPESATPPKVASEVITGRVGLHTAKAHRNVMFVCSLPVDRHQTDELLKFECRITPVAAFRDAIAGSVLIPLPVADPPAFRDLVIGQGSA